MVYEVCIPMELAAIDHLILVADIHIEVLSKGPVDADKEPVLVDPSPRPFAFD